uniref:Uncharacterized protein n=1 Tax=Leersia perrieri TaxID=77586 RepID=A0A0D9XM12_9ORYZ
MAVGFRRTLSTLTSPKAVAPASFLLDCARPKKLTSYARARSTSLPVRLHPLVAGLHDAARALLGWADAPAHTGPAWVSAGAALAGKVLDALAALLHHPSQSQSPLRRRPSTEQLLDDLLLLADLHALFRDSLLSLRNLLAETHSSLRRRDGRFRRSGVGVGGVGGERGAVAEDADAVLAGANAGEPDVDHLLRRRRTVSFEDYCNEEEEERKTAMARVRGLEECVVAAENGCEEVYRALVNARVSLLNLLTPTF